MQVQQIQHRAKTVESVRGRLADKNLPSGVDIAKEFKDLAGARIVVYTNADAEIVRGSGIIPGNFEIDWDRSKSHYPTPTSYSSDLYVGDSLVAKFGEPRIDLPEFRRFAGLWCEIQVQTTLNHAWAQLAHDTIYKRPKLGDFGSRQMRSIDDRMTRIMREHIIPAGHELQKVVLDFARLSSGKALLDRDVVAAFENCENNNERYDLLERFSAHVLPYYDDYGPVAGEILPTLVRTIEQARGTPHTPIRTAYGDLPGYKLTQVAQQAARIATQIRYLNVDQTFGTLLSLYENATDPDERKIWFDSVVELARHNMTAWKNFGPQVQATLIGRLRVMTDDQLSSVRAVALAALSETLGVEVSGTSSTFDTLTIHQGVVAFSDELRDVREEAIDTLVRLLRSAETENERAEVLRAFSAAWSRPAGVVSDSRLEECVLNNALRIVKFFGTSVNDLSFELRQVIEHDLFWLFRRIAAEEPDRANDSSVVEFLAAVRTEILAVRDRIAEDNEFTIYKTLVGIDSIFPPSWNTTSEFDFEASEEYRQREIDKLLQTVMPETANEWLQRIRRCAKTQTNDGATFSCLHEFFSKLGRVRPQMAAAFLEALDDDLAPFLSPMISGLVGTNEWPRVENALTTWLREKQYLYEIAWSIRSNEEIDVAVLREVLACAAASEDERALWATISAASGRYGSAPTDDLRRLALAAIRVLASKGNSSWVQALGRGARQNQHLLLSQLNEDETQELLSALIGVPRIGYQVEDLLAVIAATSPQLVLDFLAERFRHSRNAEREMVRYEAAPFSLHSLDKPLATVPVLLVAAARTWFEEDRGSFEYRGGQFITRVLPTFPEALQSQLGERIRSGDRDEIAFVLGILSAYQGRDFLHQCLCEIVANLPPNDDLLVEVSRVLESTQVVMGEFTLVGILEKRKTAIERWLADDRENVRNFAEKQIRTFDQRMVSEQRRTEQDHALRKLEFDPPDE